MSISNSLGNLANRKGINKLKLLLRIALRAYRMVYGRAILLFQVKRFKVAKFKKMKTLKLNVGCGKVKYPGWVNIDIEPGADLVIDIRKGVLFDDNSIDKTKNKRCYRRKKMEER